MATVTISPELVRSLAGARSYDRGELYVVEGRVRELVVDGTTVRARVDGQRSYRVRLDVTSSELSGTCSCPLGVEGEFCKHCVAVALAWLDDDTPELAEQSERSGLTDTALREFLATRDTEWLATELARAAESDPLLRARLETAAGVAADVAYDTHDLRARLEQTIEVRGYVDYRDAYAYFRDVDDVLEDVAGLIEEGFADAAIGLAEYALELLDGSAGMIDDSDGGLRVAVDRAEEIHLEACAAGNPDPELLADRLAQRALTSELEVFFTAIPDYADVLGDAGLAQYRARIRAAWDALPPASSDDYGTFAVRFLMERLAECEGGTDALIDVLARDITSSYDILRIAQRLVADGRDAEALEWLQRGFKDFEPDSRLRTLAAACHLRAGRVESGLELLWDNFAERPSLVAYQALYEVTEGELANWRTRAKALLRKQPKASSQGGRGGYLQPTGHSTLVEVLLWEDDVDAAWKAARHGGCHRELWLRLARERGKTHPTDALPILRAAAERAIEGKNRKSYQVAAGLLAEARTFADRGNREDEFAGHLAALRETYRSRPALRDELNRARLP